MAIDDNADYTLTGAQVKDLAARIKAGGSGMIVYVDASFESPSSITNVFSDSGLTTVADWEDMADAILAGGTVIAIYDNGSNKHQYVELISVTVNDNIPFGKRFAGVISSNVGEGSKPLTIFLYYDDGIVTPRWFAEGASLPTVNDATLTIQKNGTDVQTFTANQSTNATANIIVPTQFSDLSGTIDTTELADGAVTSAKIADGTIATGDIADSAITTGKIADEQITSDKLKGFSTANTTDTWVPVASNGNLQHRVIKAFNSDGSIPASALASNSVTTAKIADNAVTKAKVDDSGLQHPSVSGANCYYRRSGHFVWVSGAASGFALSANNYKTIFTLPSGYRPAIDIYCPLGLSSATKMGILRIRSSGEVQGWADSNTTYWNFNTTFAIN